MTATGRPRRLCVDRGNAVLGIAQRGEHHRGERRGAHEDEVERSLRSGGVHHSLCPLPSVSWLGGCRLSAALRLGELAQDHPAFDQGEMVDEENTVEVFDLML